MPTPRRLLVILNPRADRGRAAQRVADLQRGLGAAGRIEVRPTEGRQHAVRLAEEAARTGVDAVIAVGGDGTVHEVANGLLRLPEPQRPALGVLPAGSGNDFAFAVGLPESLAAGIEIIRSGHVRRVDAARLVAAPDRVRYWVNNVGMLLDGEINRLSHRLTWPRGAGLYCRAALQKLLRPPRRVRLQLDLDGRTLDQEAIVFSLGNGRRSGGMFHLTPDARLDDGRIDYVLLEPASRWRLLRLMTAALRGNLVEGPDIRRGQFASLAIRAEHPLTIHVDGEAWIHDEDRVTACQVEVLPAALRVLAPPSAAG
jgi:YegS/Rv2252/BmrU family lipid kinase